MVAILVALGGLTGWFAQPGLMTLAHSRAPEGLTEHARRWLQRTLIAAGSAAVGLVWLAEVSTVLRITFFAAGVVAWWLLCFDVALHKLPDPLVASLVVIVSAGYLWLYITDAAPLERILTTALAGALGLVGFGVLAIVRKSAMGFGDVKLAGALGLATGWFGLGALVQWLFASFILGGTIASILLITRRLDPKSAIAFGPWMLLGAAGVIALNVVPGMTH